MKTTSAFLAAAAALFSLLMSSTAVGRESSSRALENFGEIFRFADTDRNNNIDGRERDRLKAAFRYRRDLQILDTNRNGRLDREEINQLEKGRKKKKDPRKSRSRN